MASRKVKKTISFYNSHLISVMSISLVLFLLGLILLMGFLGSELSRYVKENISVSIVLTDDLPDEKIRRLQTDLARQPYVKSAVFISKEQALLEMQRELGENPELFLGFNPFRASIDIKLVSNYTHPDSLVMIEKQIAAQSGIADILYGKDIMQTVNQNIRRIGMVLLILLIVLIIISFVLINNTVRLLIYSKRFLIYTMRLVGATSSFIRKPFIRNNIITGLISGIIAIVLLMVSLYYAKLEFINPDDVIKSDTMLIIYGIMLISGVLLSVLAAYFALTRYLRISHRKLYYI